MRLALYQPDIPQNTGAILRTAVCMGVCVDVIEPCGFDLSDRRMKRAGMDYLKDADMIRHVSWPAFLESRRTAAGALVLLTTEAETPYAAYRFTGDDVLLMGRESAGVPATVHAAVDGRVRVPMVVGARSLNVAQVAAMVLGEALRQTQGFHDHGYEESQR